MHNRGKAGIRARARLRRTFTALEEIWLVDRMGQDWLDEHYPPTVQMEAA
jgi:hypothetical protein